MNKLFFDLVKENVFDIGSICIHGKELLRHFAFHQKTGENLTLKADVRNIWTVDIGTIRWDFLECLKSGKSSPWKQLSLVEVVSLSHAKVYVFSDSVLCLGKVNQNRTSNTAWEHQLDWFKDSSQFRTLDTIEGEPAGHWSFLGPGSETKWFSTCNERP